MIYIVLVDFIRLSLAWVFLILFGFVVTKYSHSYRERQFYTGRLIWLLAVTMIIPAGIIPMLPIFGGGLYVVYLASVYIMYVIYMPTRIHWAIKD